MIIQNILVFGHGPLTGEVDKEGNTVVYRLNNYYPGDFLEAHILMEPEIFSEYNKSIPASCQRLTISWAAAPQMRGRSHNLLLQRH